MLQRRLSTNRILTITPLASLPLVAIGSPMRAVPADIPVRTVETWLHHVEALQYEASWNEASQVFQQKLTKEKWEAILTSMRAPIGTVLARRHTVTQYASHLPGIPDGTYAILQFHSASPGNSRPLKP